MRVPGSPSSEPIPLAVRGAQGSREPVCEGAELGSGARFYSWNPVSAVGRTVFFDCPGAGVYARVDGELPDAHTLTLSEPQCGTGSAPGEVHCREAEQHPSEALFRGASADGSIAYFLDNQQLTAEASESTGGAGSAGSEDCEETSRWLLQPLPL